MRRRAGFRASQPAQGQTALLTTSGDEPEAGAGAHRNALDIPNRGVCHFPGDLLPISEIASSSFQPPEFYEHKSKALPVLPKLEMGSGG